MKHSILIFLIISLLYSCKKENNYNPDEHITYKHWYKLGIDPLDSLFSVYIPNAFTPIGDGYNDEFYCKGNCYGLGFSMSIYDKTSRLLFHTNDFNKHWNGEYNGTFVQEGVYVYRFTLSSPAGNIHEEFEGNVLLYR